MKKNIITFIVLITIIGIATYIGAQIFDFGKEMVTMADLQDANTDMLLVQAEVQSIKEEVILKDDEKLYIGEKLENSTNPKIQELINNDIVSKDSKHYKEYYIWDKNILLELNLNVELDEDEYYIVNYETFEIITTKGVTEPELNETKYAINDVGNIVEKTTNIIN